MRKLIPLLALVVASSVGAQTQSTSDSGAAAYGNNITFNSSTPEVQRVESTSTQRTEGRQEVITSGETHQYVEYGGEHSTKIKAASQAYAPPVGVTAPCIVGTSLGVAGMGWGISGGTGITDAGCERRAAAALMHAWGHQDAAKEVLCVDPTIAAAYARAGTPCRAVLLTAAAVPVSSPTAASATTREATPACYADPLVAKRAQVPVCQ